jgi:hypothetical protein
MCGPMNVGKRRGMSTLAVSEAAGGLVASRCVPRRSLTGSGARPSTERAGQVARYELTNAASLPNSP